MKMRLVTYMALLAALNGCQQIGPNARPDQASDGISVHIPCGTDFDTLSILVAAELQKLDITIHEATQSKGQYQCLGEHVSGAKVTIRAFSMATGNQGYRRSNGVGMMLIVKGERKTIDLLQHEFSYAINEAIQYDQIFSF